MIVMTYIILLAISIVALTVRCMLLSDRISTLHKRCDLLNEIANHQIDIMDGYSPRVAKIEKDTNAVAPLAATSNKMYTPSMSPRIAMLVGKTLKSKLDGSLHTLRSVKTAGNTTILMFGEGQNTLTASYTSSSAMTLINLDWSEE